MERDEILKKAEDKAGELGIYSRTVIKFSYSTNEDEMFVIFHENAKPELVVKLMQYVWTMDKEDVLFDAFIIGEGQAVGLGLMKQEEKHEY